MAQNTNRRGARNTRTGTNAMGIQRAINRDFVDLFTDYKRLGVELWRMPATKYILGGVALTALIPVALRALRDYPEVNTFVKENVEGIRHRLESVIHSGDEMIDSVQQ